MIFRQPSTSYRLSTHYKGGEIVLSRVRASRGRGSQRASPCTAVYHALPSGLDPQDTKVRRSYEGQLSILDARCD
eukprot:3615765-Prymnesium_polylepis.1